jgi:GTP-binding protein EngB required for normal cell division
MPDISLTDAQKRFLLCGFLDIHRRMEELEGFMAVTKPSPFSGKVHDLTPVEVKVVRDYFNRVRSAMVGHLRELDIPLEVRQNSLAWIVESNVMHIEITVDDLRPKSLAGYGPVDDVTRAAVAAVHDDLERLVGRVRSFLHRGLGRDLSERLARLDAEPASVATLALLERVVTRWRLVEFRPALDMVVSRLESSAFEIAVFGRVSSGKSSLLNHIAGFDVLPVGVTPVTAVPTRLAAGRPLSATVTIAESGPRPINVGEVWAYASEEGNPGNRRHVTGIVVRYPSPRLCEGVVFVDTPGIGSLATAGGAETLAYLPRCDPGVVLIDAASTLNQDDLDLLRSLYEAGIPAMVLVSKADLLTAADRDRMTSYVGGQIRRELGVDLRIHHVSTVGADEALLNQWFDREITPLLGQHRGLAESSLRRKIAVLRGAVADAVKTLLDRRCKGTSAGPKIEAEATRHFLDESERAIREARRRYQDWSDDRARFADAVIEAVARALVEGDGSKAAGGDAAGRAASDVFVRRGRAAHELVSGLLETLSESLEGLKRAAPAANTDAGSFGEEKVSGLPFPDLGALRAADLPSRPLWSSLAPPMAVRAVHKELESRSGDHIRDLVEPYDRQLQAWAKVETERIVGRYESQAEVFRELVRHQGDTDDAENAGDIAELESDLREVTQPGAGGNGRPGAPAPAEDEAEDQSTREVPHNLTSAPNVLPPGRSGRT